MLSEMHRSRQKSWAERGQVVVLFALLVPLLLTLGSVVVSVGNWYVLKRHLQTQVDAAALAGGAVANGCQANKLVVQNKMKAEALKFAGDTNTGRASAPFNQQPQDTPDVHVVLNSTRYWEQGDPTDGSTLDWTLGTPCDTKSLDVKATDDRLPLLFRWLPLFPSAKARALVELHKTSNTNGVRPIGVPEFDPIAVAALFVNEDEPTPSAAVVKAEWLTGPQSRSSPDPLADLNMWGGDVTNIELSHNENYGVVILATRDAAFASTPISLPQTLDNICNTPNQIQTHCYGDSASGGSLTSGISFIHAYSGGAPAPAVRDVVLGGGCGHAVGVGDPSSDPYFNVDETGAGCGGVTTFAVINFGVTGVDPTKWPTCATVAGMQWSAGGIGGASLGTWASTSTLTLNPGRNVVDLSGQWHTSGGTKCNDKNANFGPVSFPRVAAPFLADEDESGPVEYLSIAKIAPTGSGPANSINKTSTANIHVTVGFTPPLRDPGSLSDPPVRLRFRKGPSQTQALDCGNGAGPSGWNGKMKDGCDSYQVNVRTPVSCTPPDAFTPPDCIASENGSFNSNGLKQLWGQGCPNNPKTPNNWDGLGYPPDTDPRWIPLFILDERSTTVAGKKYYPIRRFGGFYVTAGDGLNCDGDDPSTNLNGTREVWGHFVTFIPNPFGDTIPDPESCPFTNADLCVPVLVE